LELPQNLPNNGIGRRFAVFNGVSGRADCPNDECAEHTSGRDEEELATADFVDEEAGSDGSEQVENL